MHAIKEVVASYKNYCDRYFNNVSSSQIIDGLNAFYEDYRNRTIRIADAVWIVVNEIAGMSKTESEKMIEQWRKNAIL